jgi:hypothetical protein
MLSFRPELGPPGTYSRGIKIAPFADMVARFKELHSKIIFVF